MKDDCHETDEHCVKRLMKNGCGKRLMKDSRVKSLKDDSIK